ncbi:MAG TPA: dihydrolipoyl dehydrogenase [Nitrospiria bacterium]|nr:dihydrolipoyl dehydrogenase [Nitrospiria bacterium]
MASKHYDVIILGGGPGGYVGAIRAGQLGLSVALVEKEAVGGTCLHHGCIPSKAIIRNAEVLSLIKRSADFGIQVDNVQADFGKAVDRSEQVVKKFYNGVRFLMKKNKVDVISGIGRLSGKGRITVDGENGTQEIEGERIVIATGSRVKSLPGLNIDGKRVLTSDEALLIKELPRSIVIVGAGAVGVEFAYVYAAYGVKVTLLEMLPHILPVEDEEVAAALTRAFKKQGIDVLAGFRMEKVEDKGKEFLFKVRSDQEAKELSAEAVLVAVGRAPNSDGIGLEAIGIETKKGFVVVDETLRTNVPGVWAIGDVTTRPALAHGASAQGAWLMESFAGIERPPINALNVPNATYCQPQVASVGLTEQAARNEGHEIKIGKFPLTASGKAVALGETEGFVKIISEAKTGEILGAHIIGPEATELIGEFVLAKMLESTPLEIHKSIHPHPTLSEAVMEAAGAVYGEAIHI